MNNQTIIKQLEKALECKELKEMKMRVEVLVDILKESNVIRPLMNSPSEVKPMTPVPIQPRVAGAGSIVSTNSEQLPLVRPD